MTDWRNIHPCFGEKNWKSSKSYQQEWETMGFTREEAQEWIANNFKPHDYKEVKKWKMHFYSIDEVKRWLGKNLKNNEGEFAFWLRCNNCSFTADDDLEKLRQEYNGFKLNNSQKWLDITYSDHENIKELDITGNNLRGKISFNNYKNLEALFCSVNKLGNIDVSKCLQLRKLVATNIDLKKKFILRDLPNLEELDLSSNHDNEELYIINCSKLRKLFYIESRELKKVDLSGSSLEYFGCSHSKLTDINFLSSLLYPEKLVELSLNDNYSLSFSMDDISVFSNLEVIEVSFGTKFYGDLSSLCKLCNLKKINVGCSAGEKSGGAELLPANVKEFFIANSDGSFDLQQCNNDHQLWRQENLFNKLKEYSLPQKQKVKALDLRNLKRVLDFDFLSDFSNLEYLVLSNNTILIDSLQSLRKLKKLSYLDISNTNLNLDSGLEHFLPNLQTLKCGDNEKIMSRFKIQSISNYSSYITIRLDNYVSFNNGSYNSVNCVNRFPFNQYGYYDEVEIDTDVLRSKYSYNYLDDPSLIKKLSSDRRTIYGWWGGGSLSGDDRQKLLEISNVDNLEVSSIGLQKLNYCRKLIENNRWKIDIRNTVRRIILFSTWFSPNCAFFVSDGYYITLVIYERAYNNIPETFEVVKFSEIHSSYSEVKQKLCDIESKLNGKNPILCKSSKIDLLYEKKYLPWNVKFDVYSPSDDLRDNPEKYFRPLDIIKRFNDERLSHSCVYLGSKKICASNQISDWLGYYSSSYNRIIRYHDFIPFKDKEKIIEDLAKAIVNSSSYSSVYTEKHDNSEHGNTCEHFVNRCVYGLNICEHLEIEKVKRNHSTAKRVHNFWDIKEEIQGNNKFFAGSASDYQVAEKIREIKNYMSYEESQYSNRTGEQKLEAYIEITPNSNFRITY